MHWHYVQDKRKVCLSSSLFIFVNNNNLTENDGFRWNWEISIKQLQWTLDSKQMFWLRAKYIRTDRRRKRLRIERFNFDISMHIFYSSEF